MNIFENNENIIYRNSNGIEYIQFKRLLELGIKNAYTLKGKDINFRTSDPNTINNYSKIFKELDLDINSLQKPIQRHTSNVKCIDKKESSEYFENVDGLITDKKGLTLATTNADCILLMFYDPVKKVIANVHSGWRGTFQKIAEKTLVKMITNYRCEAKDILVFICPSIRKCHFEVDEDVKKLCEDIFSFTNRLDEFIFKGKIIDGLQKYNIDTVKINRILLTDLGVKDENIIDCGICSVCNSDKISSYRVEGKDFKLATAIISL